MKKIGIVLIAAILSLSFVVATPSAYASKTEDELQSDLSDVNNQIGQAKSEYQKAKEELGSLVSQITILGNQIAGTESEIADTEALIAEYDAQLAQLAIEIAQMDEEVGDQNSALNQKLRIMYETDDGSLFTVLLGSESIVDFLSNLEMVKRIHESDRDLLDELQAKLDALEEKKAEVQKIEEMLNNQKAALVEHKNALDADKAELGVAQKRAQEIKDAAYEDLVELEKESKRIEEQLASLHSDLTYGGGPLSWPCYGRITSEFGRRASPGGIGSTNHMGIDIGVATGTAVHAAADGVVIFVGWSGGYGNFVMIDHGVLDDGSGKAIVTCYAHNSGFAVSSGQAVLKGQTVAYAGSTGNSTGPHCHFEVRVGGTPQNPRGWL
ncbi:MAG: peptidoglycan DD-metalloendopeptidase family protein [Clostridiales Family XIII bacterium]|jgi:murein DD-endopeptidase MepM/ murein hydrolase activator NlpD|nr:peptidoglycan DD-metalloendopeptidase family protein [Clostridiales Family XIII bacterium]